MIPIADIPAPVLKFVVGFWRRRWIILGVAWSLAVPGWFFVAQLPDTYTSSTKVHVRTDSMLDRVLDGVAPRPAFQDRVDLLRLRLLARPNVEQVAREVGIDTEANSALAFDRAVRGLEASVKVQAIRDDYFGIKYVSSDPIRAQQVVNGFLNVFIESDLSTTLSGMDRARSYLDQQIASFDQQINRRQREVAEFRRQYATELNAPARMTANIERAEEQIDALADEHRELSARKAEVFEELGSTPRAAKATDPELEALRERLLDYQTQYTDEYPQVVALKERIRELESRLDARGAVNPAYAQLENAIELIEKRQGEIDAERDRLRAEIREYEEALNLAPAALADLEDIRRGLDSLEDRRRELEDRRLSLEISAGAGESGERIDYDIVEEPVVPLEPDGPPRALFTMLVLVAAIGAGGAAALGLILIDRSYSQADDLEAAFGIPVIGTVSIVAAGVATVKRFRQLGLFAAGVIGLAAVAGAISLYFIARPGAMAATRLAGAALGGA